mgnify:CR=1 FL=1
MANIYDRVIKEIIEPLLKPLAQIALHLQFNATREIKDKIHVTLEREGDHLKLLLFDDQTNNCILHLEFHVMDEDIGKLMLLKKGMLIVRLDKAVRQYVIYMGGKRKLKNLKPHYHDDKTHHRFEVIYLNRIAYQEFLQYDIPEVVIMAILGDFNDKTPEQVIREIIAKLNELTVGQPGSSQHFTRLEVLSNLRNLQHETIKIVNDMAFTYEIEKDLRYRQGVEEGMEKGIEKGMEKGMEKGIEKKTFDFVCNLLAAASFTDEMIASLAAVSVEYVKKVKETVKTNPPVHSEKKTLPAKKRKTPSARKSPGKSGKTENK